MTLAPHPRLYTTRAEFERLSEPPELPVLQTADAENARLAEEFTGSLELTFNPALHNALLNRAREMQRRVVTLLVRWRQTGETRFRASAMEHLRAMAQWEYWASVAADTKDSNIEEWFDLSYGENCTTLALAYDWLHETLADDERALLVDQARSRGMRAFLNVLAKRRADPGYWQGSWFGNPNSNWNTVCAGGAGMLALSMHEEFPEMADEVIALAEESVRPYFESLAATDGGWMEGIGYWNYGHRYAFMYVLSHENATGRAHPFLALPGVRETLSFPMDFVPNGQYCSFPDVNHWWPLAWHYKAALRLGHEDLIPALTALTERLGMIASWPEPAEFLTLHPRISAPANPPGEPAADTGPGVTKLYPKMDWGILADRMPKPRLYLAAKGGSNTDPHGMIDVLSFYVVVGDERLILNYSNSGGDEYMQTTFSQRRNDIFEVGQAAKNVPFINGVGLPVPARVETRAVEFGGCRGFRMDSTSAYGFLRGNNRMVDFSARLFLMLDCRAFLIVDRFEMPLTGRTEVRMHSYGHVEEVDKTGFLIQGEREKLRVVYACDVPATTATAVACPTKPMRGANVLRWCTETRTHTTVTMATLLVPGDAPATLRLGDDGTRLRLEATGEGWRTEISVSRHLEP